MHLEYRQNLKNMLIYIRICPNGGTGRRTRLKIVRETMWVRVPLWAPIRFLFERHQTELIQKQSENKIWLIFCLKKENLIDFYKHLFYNIFEISKLL